MQASSRAIHEITAPSQKRISSGTDPVDLSPDIFFYPPGAPGDHCVDMLNIARSTATAVHPSPPLTEQGPCLVDGVITLNDASLTTKISLHSDTAAVHYAF